MADEKLVKRSFTLQVEVPAALFEIEDEEQSRRAVEQFWHQAVNLTYRERFVPWLDKQMEGR